MQCLRTILWCICLGLSFCSSYAQTRKTENLLIIGWDGVRWQEIFTGVDSALMVDPAFTKRSGGMRNQFWSDTIEVRRRKLFPFFWSVLSQDGQLYGNRTLGNKIDVANPYNLTGPGFTETLVCFADPAINSNNKVLNNSTNVFEFINNQKGYKGKVAVFAMSNLF